MKLILKILGIILNSITSKSKTIKKPLVKTTTQQKTVMNNKMKIALVVGHSEDKKGAYNSTLDIHEYDLNNQEAISVSDKLNNQGIECVLIYRTTYKDLPDDINKHNPDAILSFHHNSHSPTATGTETLYYEGSVKGKKLAEMIHKQTVDVLGYKDRGIKSKDDEDRGGYLLEYTKAPCLILEPCFMSNSNELKDFLDKQDIYCDAIVNGIKEYINS